MTRISVYSAALVAIIAATAMTLTAIIVPEWISYSVTASTGRIFWKTVGLHETCSSATLGDPDQLPSASASACRHFPADSECLGGERDFCSMWRSTGFLMSLATVLELATLVGFLVIMAGGKAKRERGWRVLAALFAAVAGIQFAAMAIVAYLFDHDEKFDIPGWKLDTSWYLCTVSGAVAVLSGLGLAISAFVLPPENGYEFLRDPTGA